jgi:inorganic pyrophosphatase
MTNLVIVDPQLDETRRCCRAIVETSQGSRSKYDYDREIGTLHLAAVLPAGMAFPLSFGFIPSTLGDDGDPLDILILSDEPLSPGASVTAQILGVLEADQTEKGTAVRNDRLLAKVAQSHSWADIKEAQQLGTAFSGDLSKFFETYNALRGREFRLRRMAGSRTAWDLIKRGLRKD